MLGNTAFHEASVYNRVGVLPILIEAGARFKTNAMGFTQMHAALARRDPPVTDAEALATLKALMKTPGIDAAKELNRTGNDGGTPLIMAAMTGLVNSCKYLVEQKADVHASILKGCGTGALHAAIEHDQVEAAKFLVSAGACTHPFMHNGKLNCTLSEFAKSPRMQKWCKMVQKPVLKTCAKCGVDFSREGMLKLLSDMASVKSKLHAINDRCSNPACTGASQVGTGITITNGDGTHDRSVVRLKKCGRCFKAAYCTVECQREHWKAGHKQECKQRAKPSDDDDD